MSTWLITGAGRGLGFEIARRVLETGNDVVATARALAVVSEAFRGVRATGRILPVALDVTDESQAHAAVAAAVAEFGGIDFVVNNAGRGLLSDTGFVTNPAGSAA